MHGRWVHAVVLIPLALFAFFHNLGISLFKGSEGLYAHITHEMVERGDYVHLTYQGEAYVYKSPCFSGFSLFRQHCWGRMRLHFGCQGRYSVSEQWV